MIDLTSNSGKAPGISDEASPAPDGDDLFPVLSHQHDSMKAQYDKLSQSRSMLDKVRVELDHLSGLGEALDQEAVIKSAGKLVSHGLGASAMASLLADMPEGGEALHDWVTGHEQTLAKQEAQIDPALAEMRHHLGLAGLRLIAAHLHPDAPRLLGRPSSGGSMMSSPESSAGMPDLNSTSGGPPVAS